MARSTAALALLLAALAVCAEAASITYVFCTVGMNATNNAGCVAVPNAGTCTSTQQPVDGNCYCGNPATGAGCLKFTSISGASAMSAAIWNTTNNCAGAASLTWAGLPTTNLCAPSDQSGWFVMSAVPTSAGARAAVGGRPGWSAALVMLLLAALQC